MTGIEFFEITVTRVNKYIPEGQTWPREDKVKIMKLRADAVNPYALLVNIINEPAVFIQGEKDVPFNNR